MQRNVKEESLYGLLANMTREMSAACLFTKKEENYLAFVHAEMCYDLPNIYAGALRNIGSLFTLLHRDSPANAAFFSLLSSSLLVVVMLKRSGAHMEKSHLGG